MKVECGKCGKEMIELHQAEVLGLPTLRLYCNVCKGKADVQVQGKQARQVQLQNTPDEYRPKSILPNADRVELEHPSAFALGERLSPLEHAARAAKSQREQQARAAANAPMTDALAQAQAMAQAQAAQAQAHLDWLRAEAQRRGLVPAPVRQPVAFSLGMRPGVRPVMPMPPNQLRRHLLGGG
jgi:hypothetical protein